MDNGMATLLSLLGNSAGNGKSFSDMLRERRNFVQGAENGYQGQVDNVIKNGSNGVPVSPAALNTPLNDFYTKNEDATTGLINGILGNLVSQENAQREQQIQEEQNMISAGDLQNRTREQNRQDFLAGLSDQSGNPVTSGNSVLDLHAKNIMNGTETLNDVPQELRPRVAQSLTQAGYDPAKPLNSLVDQLQSEFSGTGSGDTGQSLAYGNNPLRALEDLFGQGAHVIGLNTGYNKQQNSYNT